MRERPKRRYSGPVQPVRCIGILGILLLAVELLLGGLSPQGAGAEGAQEPHMNVTIENVSALGDTHVATESEYRSLSDSAAVMPVLTSAPAPIFAPRTDVVHSPTGSVPFASQARSPDGSKYAREVEPPDMGMIGIFEQASGALLRAINVGLPSDRLQGLAWSPDSRKLAVMYIHSGAGSIAVLDTKTDQFEYFPVSKEAHFMAFSDDGMSIAASTAGSAGTIEWVSLRRTTLPATVPPSPIPTAGIQKGINYTAYRFGDYRAPSSDQSLRNLAATGANSIELLVTGYQDTIASTTIEWVPPRTPSDDDLIHAIAMAHSLGLRVMLKPTVDLSQDDAHWRGQIGTPFKDEEQWQLWFSSYRNAILHYAELAETHHVEQFCIGTELETLSRRAQDWRRLVGEVRQRFKGSLTYASNFGGEETSIEWWDALDYIGVNAYYSLTSLTDKRKPTVDDLKTAWVQRGYLNTLETLATRWKKPLLFTEIGYESIQGAAQSPNEWRRQLDMPVNQQEQADAYQAAIETFADKPWFAGFYWWNWWSWQSDPSWLGPQEGGYTPCGKLAESVLKRYYSSATGR